MQILQQHYPERLGRFVVSNVPWLLAAFVKIVMAFLDPVTRGKIVLNPNVVGDGLIDANQLMTSDGWGGKINFVYEQDKYWPALLDMARIRREENMARWRALGGKVGLDEWSIKGGPTTTPLAGKTDPEKATETVASTNDIPILVV
jgi:hypothetical protein